jgi:hypothetical protein
MKHGKNLKGTRKNHKSSFNQVSRFNCLLDTLWNEDIPKIINNPEASMSTPAIARPYSDIYKFLTTVCEDLIVLYPNIGNDSDYLLRIFTRIIREQFNTTV